MNATQTAVGKHLTVSTFLGIALTFTTSAVEGIVFPTGCIPPPGGYGSVAPFHQTYAGVPAFDLTDVSHFGFNRCDDPALDLGLVNPGDTATHSFGSHIRMNTSFGGFRDDDVAVTVRLTLSNISGPTRFFDTEMLQLNISGGTLPPEILIREDPDRQSLGQLTIRELGPGSFDITSFFDVFTELSVDGGSTFHDSVGPGRVVLMPLPEGSSLALLIAGLGLMGVARRRKAVQGK